MLPSRQRFDAFDRIVASGLAVHGKRALAQRLRDDLVALVANAGLREYFNPQTGSGHGTTNFSWSAALLIHVLAEGSMNAG